MGFVFDHVFDHVQMQSMENSRSLKMLLTDSSSSIRPESRETVKETLWSLEMPLVIQLRTEHFHLHLVSNE